MTRHDTHAQAWARATATVAELRALPPALRTRRQNPSGMPQLTPAVVQYLGRPRKDISNDWMWVFYVQRDPCLAQVGRATALHLGHFVKALAPARRQHYLQTWLGLPPGPRAAAIRAFTTGQPPRSGARQAPAQTAGARWHAQLVEIRQHLLGLKQEGLIEQLARSWTPENQQGYRTELQQLVEELTDLQRRLHAILDRPRLALVQRGERP